MLNHSAIRKQFPILSRQIDGHPLVYLDTAATAQKPYAVLDAMREFQERHNANAHRGMHVLAEAATQELERSRQTVQRFLHAAHHDEIVFTKNATESINLVAQTYGSTLTNGDAIALSILEHHSNIVPWLMLQDRQGVELRWLDVDDKGCVRREELERTLADGRVKLLAITAQSNVTGSRPDVTGFTALAHAHGARVLVDAAQHVAHHPTHVQEWDADFAVFSGHKLYGPTGIGVLYGKRELLRAMPPFLGGGGMIQSVTTQGFQPADAPAKFEAGTQPLAEAVGLRAAMEWVEEQGWTEIEAHERALSAHAHTVLLRIPGLLIMRDHPGASGCISFTLQGVHPHDLTEMVGRQGICLRAGHHCAQPLHDRLGVSATTRLSVGLYNTPEEITAASQAIQAALHTLRA